MVEYENKLNQLEKEKDLTPIRYKLLKYMQKSCSHTFTSCYTRNGNIKAKLKTTEKWVTITSLDDLLKHGIDVDCKQMGCGEVLNNELCRRDITFHDYFNNKTARGEMHT